MHRAGIAIVVSFVHRPNDRVHGKKVAREKQTFWTFNEMSCCFATPTVLPTVGHIGADRRAYVASFHRDIELMISSSAFCCSPDRPAILRARRRDNVVVSDRTPVCNHETSSFKKSASACHISRFCGSVSPFVQRCTAALVIDDLALPRCCSACVTPSAMFSSVKLRRRLTMFKRSANDSVGSTFICGPVLTHRSVTHFVEICNGVAVLIWSV